MEKDIESPLALVVLIMREIHAYINEDGTYRVDGIGSAMENGELKEVVVQIPRANVTVDALIKEDTGEIFSITVKEN